MFNLLAVTQDGSVHLFRRSGLVWTREESLSQVADGAFLDLPSTTTYSEHFDELNEEPGVSASIGLVDRYIRRWNAHIAKLMVRLCLPQTVGRSGSNNATADTLVLGDAHGFRKLLIIASTTGKVNALDTLTGKTVWSRFYDNLQIESITVLRTARVKFPPVVALVGRSGANTVVWRINGVSGQDFVSAKQGLIPARSVLGEGKTQVSLVGVQESDEYTQVLGFVDATLSLSLFPDTDAAHEAFERIRPSWHLYRIVGQTGARGYSVSERSPSDRSYATHPIWSLELPEGETIAAVSSPDASSMDVASLGRVLGDRRVLFKYMGPNLLGLASVRKGSDDAVTTFVYIIDTVSGAIHYRSAHHAAGQISDAVPAIRILQCENWFAYTVWNHGPQGLDEEVWNSIEETMQLGLVTEGGGATSRKKKRRAAAVKKSALNRPLPDSKHLEMVVIEAYEHTTPDVRVDVDTVSSYSYTRPGFLTQAYVFPLPISAMGVTRTKAGITTREVLLGLDTGMLYGLSKRFLDPRRSTGKMSAEDKEAGMYPYVPSLGFATKEVASHTRSVFGIQHIISAATNLESTSVVASYGLDVFVTRRMPSQTFDMLSADFSYAGLIATIVALVAGIFAAKHFVSGWSGSGWSGSDCG
ncbi:hypothetical protein BC831DRAFT_401158 [Entophlyctis helioformis]|nr:hypothetical protein BC831DRAFT_401158 [Entophlyctis helioformis]